MTFHIWYWIPLMFVFCHLPTFEFVLLKQPEAWSKWRENMTHSSLVEPSSSHALHPLCRTLGPSPSQRCSPVNRALGTYMRTSGNKGPHPTGHRAGWFFFPNQISNHETRFPQLWWEFFQISPGSRLISQQECKQYTCKSFSFCLQWIQFSIRIKIFGYIKSPTGRRPDLTSQREHCHGKYFQ